jgi:ribosomal protein S18 acetylase RimI-like enzyme
MNETIFREASEADLDALESLNLEIHRIHLERESDVFKPLSREAIREHMRGFLSGKDAVTIVAEKNGRLVGFAQARTEESRENIFQKALRRGVINAIGVSAAEKRSRIGTGLLEAAENWIRERGFHEVLLNVWEFNESAIRFYESRGYFTSSRKMGKKLP